VLAIPEKRFDTALISYLTEPEVDALLAAPDRSTWTGRRDHVLLLMGVQTGHGPLSWLASAAATSTSTPAPM
jgi:site-specific recombinase XerD